MDEIRIRIDTGDMEFDRRLQRRLAESYEAFIISLGRASDTDAKDDIVLDTAYPGPLLPVSKLMSDLAGILWERSGKVLYRPKNGSKRVFCLTSFMGGCGLSSISFVLSRLIQMRMGEQVLYIDCGRPGSFRAYEGNDNRKPVNELLFLMGSGRAFSLEDYILRDHYGVKVLILGDPCEDVLLRIIDQAEADHVVISSEKEPALPDMTRIRVFNSRDSRITDEMRLIADDEIKVINREFVNRVEDSRVLIADDTISFINPEGSPVILMKGEFSAGVEKLLKKVF